MKTLVELFDECQIENVIAGLRFKPERIVYIGFKEVMTNKRISDLKRLFDMRGYTVSPEFVVVGRYDYKAIVEALERVLDRYDDCAFDLTGGRELVLTAMGEISAKREVPMLQFDVKSGKLITVKNCENLAEPEETAITIRESVVLNGGVVVSDDHNEFAWDLTEDFKKDIDVLWNLCREHCSLWNKQSLVLGSFEKFNMVEGLWVDADLEFLRRGKKDTMLHEHIFDVLTQNGLIQQADIRKDTASFRYKNEQVKEMLSKGGNILELYAYKTAKEIAEDDPGYYDDIDIGIFVDWDGVLHDGTTAERDTRNEIDVLLMRDFIPVFISCKNGEVKKEALYELFAVAEKFGGEYAKKILLTTYISRDEESRRYIKQRARDMKIDIIEGVDKMEKEEFMATFKSRAK